MKGMSVLLGSVGPWALLGLTGRELNSEPYH